MNLTTRQTTKLNGSETKHSSSSFTMEELKGELEEIRPGRSLFIRHYQVGSPDAQKKQCQIVAVHGLCATERQYESVWASLQELLHKNHPEWSIDCLSYDWMGCGQSPRLPDWDAYETDETVQDLKAFLARHVDKQKPLILMGHSYGPNIIMRALKETNLPNLKGLILLSTAFRNDNTPELIDGGPWIMKLPVFLLNLIQPQLTNAFCEMAVHKDHANLKKIIRDDSNGNDMFMAKAYHRHTQWLQMDEVIKQHLPPILFIHGAEDGLIPLRHAQAVADRLDAQLVTVEHASHLVMLEQPSAVAEAIYEFLSTIVR